MIMGLCIELLVGLNKRLTRSSTRRLVTTTKNTPNWTFIKSQNLKLQPLNISPSFDCFERMLSFRWCDVQQGVPLNNYEKNTIEHVLFLSFNNKSVHLRVNALFAILRPDTSTLLHNLLRIVLNNKTLGNFPV